MSQPRPRPNIAQHTLQPARRKSGFGGLVQACDRLVMLGTMHAHAQTAAVHNCRHIPAAACLKDQEPQPIDPTRVRLVVPTSTCPATKDLVMVVNAIQAVYGHVTAAIASSHGEDCNLDLKGDVCVEQPAAAGTPTSAAAELVGPVPTATKGLVVVALRALRAGTVVLLEDPLLRVPLVNEQLNLSHLAKAEYCLGEDALALLAYGQQGVWPQRQMEQLMAGLVLAAAPVGVSARVLALFAPDPVHEPTLTPLVDDLRDMYHRYAQVLEGLSQTDFVRISLIIKCNGFQHTDTLSGLPCAVLYDQGSRFSHACNPNCSRTITADGRLLVHLLQDVCAGQELTFSYLRPDKMLESKTGRQHYLNHYLFQCDCERCTTSTDDMRAVVCPTCHDPEGTMHLGTLPVVCAACHHALPVEQVKLIHDAEEQLKRTLLQLCCLPTADLLEAAANVAHNAGLHWRHYLVLRLYDLWAVAADTAGPDLVWARVIRGLLVTAAMIWLLPLYPLPARWKLESLAPDLDTIYAYADAHGKMAVLPATM